VDQGVKGGLGRTVDVRIPARPENGGQRIPEDVAAGIVMSRVEGHWVTSRCGIMAPGVLLATADEPRGGAIKVVIGLAILGCVLLYSWRRLRRRRRHAEAGREGAARRPPAV
jgi:hypothetical protein